MAGLAAVLGVGSPFRRRQVAFLAFAVVFAAVALAQAFNDYQASILTWIGVEVVVLLGFNLLFGTAGQMAFSHIFFVAVGAYTSAIVMLTLGQSFLVAGVCAVVVGTALAGVFGVLLLRLRAFYLAVASLILPLFIPGLATLGGSLTGGLSGLSGVPLPFDSHAAYLAVVAVVAVTSYWCVQNLLTSAAGRAWASIREDETAALALGVDVYGYKIRAFVLSSAMATLGGVFYGPIFGFISPTSFGLNTMLPIVMASVVGGMSWAIGAITGALVLVYLPELLDAFADVAPLIYALLLLLALRFMPEGLVGGARDAFEGLRSRATRVPEALSLAPMAGAEPPPEASLAVRDRDRADRRSLRVEGVDLHYGGLHVLDEVSLEVEPGAVRGLIGPNGAGKTTLFNVISGFAVPDKGRVLLGDEELTLEPPSARAQRGIARTFQAVHIFQEMSVLENVLVGMHVRMRPGLFQQALQLPSVRRSEAEARDRARALLDLVGLGQFAERPANGLPFGSLKRLEIARALAIGPSYLLLDEPVGGLHPTEIAGLEEILGAIAASGIGVLLVEHNVPFVMRVCERVLVLDHGSVIADGSVVEVTGSPQVIEAYLGSSEAVAV